ncbi:Uncharacterised protein [Citrobacter koseri]|nr:Uncharacterised protein [Citrobacter koseri]
MSVLYPLIQALVLFAAAPLPVRYYPRGACPGCTTVVGRAFCRSNRPT